MSRLQWSCWETQLLPQPWYNTVLLYGSLAEASLPRALYCEGMLPAWPQHKTPSLCHCLGSGAWLQLIPRAWLLLPGGCRLH